MYDGIFLEHVSISLASLFGRRPDATVASTPLVATTVGIPTVVLYPSPVELPLVLVEFVASALQSVFRMRRAGGVSPRFVSLVVTRVGYSLANTYEY